ncbi:MAG TPA: ankyrin repeat domain-containing protein [Chthonomonadaceae bacterium]|nr:ankyrin repeat domain-containing protein [Chthonomonadaceae bacterium]
MRTIKMPQKKRMGLGLLVSLLIVLGLLVGITSWRIYREYRQEQLDRQLIRAIEHNATSDVLTLLAQGANANAQDKPPDLRPFWRIFLDIFQHKPTQASTQPSALAVACNVESPYESFLPVYADTSPIVQALLEHGADVHTKSVDGENLPIIAAEHKQYASLRILVAHGAVIMDVDEDGQTLLMLAVQSQDVGSAKLLIDRGINVNAQARHGDTALMMAAEQGNAALVKLLLDKGADVNAHDQLWGTALIDAASEGHTDCVKLLLDRGADINADSPPPGQGTALMHAVIKGHLQVVKLLLARGANPNTSILPIVAHATRTSPLSYARDSGREDIVTVLKKAGAKE